MADINRLTIKQQLAFAEYLRQEYTKSHLDDGEFAKVATTAMGLQKPLNRQHVKTMREAMDIPNNRVAGNGLKSPIVLLERRVKVLEDRLDILTQGSRK